MKSDINSFMRACILAGLASLIYLGMNVLYGIHFSIPSLVAIILFFLLVVIQQSIFTFFITRRNIAPRNIIGSRPEVIDQDLALKKINPTIQEMKLSQLPNYDELTGLPNKAFFNEILHKAMNHASRHKKILAVLLIQLDSSNHANQRFGKSADNQVEDLIIKEIAALFIQALRSEDVLAKLDTDEFIVLLNDIEKPKFASAVSEKLLTACAKPILINSKKITLKANIGICIYPDDANSIEELLNCSNEALSKSRNEGEGNYSFYSKDTNIEAHEYVNLSQLLRSAINNKEFLLYFQPKLHLKSGNITGVETLLRWMHPKFGLISPEKFISIAEETNLIIPISEWILQEACKINKFWQTEEYEHMTISVNLSPKQFYHPDITNAIKKALENSKLDAHYLEVEVSEDIVMNDIDVSMRILESIKNTGVKISIDHFGTGYISVRHLKNLPINSLKIDKTFINGVPAIPNDTTITNAFIMLAHNLGLEAVAEGVETIEQAEYLASQQCDIVQGYFLTPPVSSDKVIVHFKKLRETIL